MMTPHEYLAQIGRKGGQVKGAPKGFAAMSPERAKKIRAKAAAARRKQATARNRASA